MASKEFLKIDKAKRSCHCFLCTDWRHAGERPAYVKVSDWPVQGLIRKGETRVSYGIAKAHAKCFVKMVLQIPELNEIIDEVLPEAILARMKGK